MSELLLKSTLSEYGDVLSWSVRGELIYTVLQTDRLDLRLKNTLEQRLFSLGYQCTFLQLSSRKSESGYTDIVDIALNPVSRSGLFSGYEPEAFAAESVPVKWHGHPLFHAALFGLTFIIVFITGAATIINRSVLDEWDWWIGIQYAGALIAILTAHEFGHYFAARYHRLKVTLPYFLPGILIPPWIMSGFGGTTIMPGTFGAFIRIKSPIETRRQLMDIGAAGPIAGFIVSLAVLILGFVFIPPKDYAYQYYEVSTLYDGQPVIHFGSSILFSALGALLAGDNMPAMYDIIHYPLLFAGWFGLLVTALNLLPIGQLDGGHILYALVGPRQKYFAIAAFALIISIGLLYDIKSWFIWAILIIFIIRIQHPPVQDSEDPLDKKRMIIGILAIIIFALCFIPAPIYDKVLTMPD